MTERESVQQNIQRALAPPANPGKLDPRLGQVGRLVKLVGCYADQGDSDGMQAVLDVIERGSYHLRRDRLTGVEMAIRFKRATGSIPNWYDLDSRLNEITSPRTLYDLGRNLIEVEKMQDFDLAETMVAMVRERGDQNLADNLSRRVVMWRDYYENKEQYDADAEALSKQIDSIENQIKAMLPDGVELRPWDGTPFIRFPYKMSPEERQSIVDRADAMLGDINPDGPVCGYLDADRHFMIPASRFGGPVGGQSVAPGYADPDTDFMGY